MKSKRRISGILVAMILAIIGTVALVGYVQSAKDKALAEEAMVDVYMIDTLVPKGAGAETIKSSVSVEQVPARLKQPGAVTDLEEVGDNVAATDLQPGDQLLAARLAPQDEVTVEVDDKVQISLMLTPERAVGGSLEKGDLVGVYLSFEPFELDEAGQETETTAAPDPAAAQSADALDEAASADSADTADSDESDESDESDDEGPEKTPNVTRLEFQHVLVTNVQTTNEPVVPEENDQEGIEQITGSQYVVTLALSPEESERLVFATEFGHVWLSNQPATVSDDGTRLVTLGNVYKVVQ